jgi:hypothetical protein
MEIGTDPHRKNMWDFMSEHWFASPLIVFGIGIAVRGTIVGVTRAITGPPPTVVVDFTPLVNFLQNRIR